MREKKQKQEDIKKATVQWGKKHLKLCKFKEKTIILFQMNILLFLSLHYKPMKSLFDLIFCVFTLVDPYIRVKHMEYQANALNIFLSFSDF